MHIHVYKVTKKFEIDIDVEDMSKALAEAVEAARSGDACFNGGDTRRPGCR